MGSADRTVVAAKPPGPSQGAQATPDEMATSLRVLAMDAVERAKSGHPGMPMGMADVATVLVTRFLKFDASAPRWPDRDRLVLSAGHGSMLLYGLMYLTGYEDIDLDQLKRFRQLGSRTAGHPEYGLAAGIETTTGPLGQGFGNAVGMALAERMLAARFGDAVVDHYTYVMAGDGDLMEGIGQEALSLAGHLGLGKLIVLFDDNHVSIDGPTDLAVSDDQPGRFRASGWDVAAVDGHDMEAVAGAITRARQTDAPSLIACRTTIGFGAPTKEGTAACHGAPLGPEEVAGARKRLGWSYPPFEVPDHIVSAWRAVGARGAAARTEWEARMAALEAPVRAELERRLAGELPGEADAALEDLKRRLAEEGPRWATRKASGVALSALVPVLPELIGGSADLSGSNVTHVESQTQVRPGDYGGRYIHYGVREHVMAAAMNGIALHGGFIPYGGTFLVFTDYCRPAIRLAALMGQRVIYVLTHDSIGLGQDGPTHQPVEHLAALRAIPNLCVFRPADAVETAECWQTALAHEHRPSALVLSRQSVAAVRTRHESENLSARGAYVLAPASGGAARATLLATGSEVELAMEARDLLQEEGVPTAVVSMPCLELFEEQDGAYRAQVLGQGTVRVAVEAGVRQGWDRYVGDGGAVIGMTSFGASAPGPELYEHFGITAQAVVAAVRERL